MTKTTPVIYISGPITKGRREDNLHQAFVAHRQLMLAGYAPINPMLTMLLPFAWEPGFPHELWMQVDLPIVERCDGLLRLPGESTGADQEVAHAIEHGVPVFFDFKELAAGLPTGTGKEA